MIEKISSKQAISIMILFTVGTTIILGGSYDAKQDSWISFILAMVAALPIIFVYARILKLYPGKNLFDICLEVFGTFIGKIFVILFTWYALHLGALVLRNFAEFIQVVAMPETPHLPFLLIMAVLLIWIIKSGIETMGRWALITAPILILIIIFSVSLSIKDMDIKNILPIMENSISKISSGALSTFSFPLAETVLFMVLFGSLKEGTSPYKVYYSGMIIGGLTVLINAYIRNILVLGFPLLSSVYFPTYRSVQIISYGNFLSRIEGSIAANFLIATFIKSSVCMLVVAKGFATIFNLKNYRDTVAPLALLMIVFTSIVYNNVDEMFKFLDVYKYYALPFQILLPLIILITAEIKNKKSEANTGN